MTSSGRWLFEHFIIGYICLEGYTDSRGVLGEFVLLKAAPTFRLSPHVLRKSHGLHLWSVWESFCAESRLSSLAAAGVRKAQRFTSAKWNWMRYTPNYLLNDFRCVFFFNAIFTGLIISVVIWVSRECEADVTPHVAVAPPFWEDLTVLHRCYCFDVYSYFVWYEEIESERTRVFFWTTA